MRIGFWNAGKTASLQHVLAFVQDQDLDILVLAEPADSEVSVLEHLNTNSAVTYHATARIPGDFQLFTRIAPDHVSPVSDGSRLAIRHIQPVLDEDFLLGIVHLPSKLALSAAEQAQLSSRWSEMIKTAERKVGHARTVLVGDFNMNPFEDGMITSEGLHAVSSRAVAARQGRRVYDVYRDFFYNPMWSFLAEDGRGPGTYYYAGSGPLVYFWNTFDQALLRPSLAARFQGGDVNVVSKVGEYSLLTKNGHPRVAVSDHLPLVVSVRLEEVASYVEESVG